MAGVVESAVLLGTPVGVQPELWRAARSAVAGRLVNGFSRRDWILGLVYRGSKGAPPGRRHFSPPPLFD